jgi:hypothetical protein
MTMSILAKLEGGDRRSIGNSEEVVQTVSKNPALFEELFSGLLADDPVVRMRAADAIEKLLERDRSCFSLGRTCCCQPRLRSKRKSYAGTSLN